MLSALILAAMAAPLSRAVPGLAPGDPAPLPSRTRANARAASSRCRVLRASSRSAFSSASAKKRPGDRVDPGEATNEPAGERAGDRSSGSNAERAAPPPRFFGLDES